MSRAGLLQNNTGALKHQLALFCCCCCGGELQQAGPAVMHPQKRIIDDVPETGMGAEGKVLVGTTDPQGREHPGDHLAPSRVAPLLGLQDD
jgi:hypothetical protein